MADEPFRKIQCNGEFRGERCGRWLARVEGGTLYIACPKCGGFAEVPLVSLASDLVSYVRQLEGEDAEVQEDGIEGAPKPFGNGRR